ARRELPHAATLYPTAPARVTPQRVLAGAGVALTPPGWRSKGLPGGAALLGEPDHDPGLALRARRGSLCGGGRARARAGESEARGVRSDAGRRMCARRRAGGILPDGRRAVSARR